MNVKILLIGMSVLGLAVVIASKPDSSTKEKPMNTKEVSVRLLDEKGNLTPPMDVPRVLRPEIEWEALLTKEQYQVTRGHGTERAFCGVFHDNKKEGVYFCVACGLPLFRSDAKFESGTGWPSFFQPVAKENIGEQRDASHGMVRVEIHCARCDSHLGHVFEDGPKPTGLRYCLNSVAMDFVENKSKSKTETAMFGAGCFWGVEEKFRQTKGVVETAVGYSGGFLKKPTYKDVCNDDTGHAEVVQVKYDPSKVSYDQLLDVFWNNHNPTTLNRQGPDVGTQYRSVIYFYTPAQETVARASLEKLRKSGKFTRPIVTHIELAREFNRAEEYHQQYLSKRGLGECHVQ